MRLYLLFALCAAAVAADTRQGRIVGGDVTTIDRWPSMANVLFSVNGITFEQSCGGVILNQRSILSAAHCFVAPEWRYRIRLGSSFASSGGTVYNVAAIINHPSYNTPVFMDNDISLLHLASNIVYSNVIQPASIGSYTVADNQAVWATGWGLTEHLGSPSEQLREVQIYTVNQSICAARYSQGMGATITENMLCSGVLDVGGRDQCQQDSGGPLYHNGVVVGICSWGGPCADAFLPGINARVSRYISWISSNA